MKHKSSHAYVESLPSPLTPFHVALIEPEIPPNTGNIARSCAATGSVLHLVGPLGFNISNRQLKRAGLDYWESVDLVQHGSWKTFQEAMRSRRLLLFSTRGQSSYTQAEYRPGDVLVFGGETRGLDPAILEEHPGRVYAIPMRHEHVRSLNLSTAVGIVLYEAIRQAAGPG